MPAEVLVMCSACGRPQSAARRRCAFCNAVLPEAPLPPPAPASRPPPSMGPLAVVNLGNGRGLSVGVERLTFQGRAKGSPVDVAWIRVRRLEWRSRPYLEALALLAFTVLGFWAPYPAMRLMGFLAGAVGLLLAALYRHHALTVEVEDGVKLQWPLGQALRGSAREARLVAGLAALTAAARSRGVPLDGPDA
ncbi:hypothetical protein [Corallococcus llansteffanensis]|uniref:Uncharacterized protein n=1 Tax=Corallococcus llansteffanensis TaxID=2316731 RepID=A0A3A8PCL4_9BACT|nr:hypothetical protein [Corallococcus llansteffanensis]RKH53040.1 hypothetical protein D7V93_27265 [Corallococcus llansteffanensis]